MTRYRIPFFLDIVTSADEEAVMDMAKSLEIVLDGESDNLVEEAMAAGDGPACRMTYTESEFTLVRKIEVVTVVTEEKTA